MRFVATVGGCFEPSFVIVMAVFVLKQVGMFPPKNDSSPRFMLLYFFYNF